MKKASLLFLISISWLSLYAQNEPLPIIDMHMHADTTLWSTYLPRYPNFWEGPEIMVKNISELLPKTVEEMKKNNVVLGIITAENLEEVYRWKTYAPERFLTGVAFFDPLGPDISFLRKEFLEGRLSVVGEIAAQYNGFAPNDPQLGKFYGLAEELDVPLLIHCGGLAGENKLFNISDGNPLRLEEVLKKFPTLRIYIENASYPYIHEIIALMYRYPNVYADLSTFSWIIPIKTFHNYLEDLIDAGLGKRLMFGSDQMIFPETISMAIDAIETADFLTKEQKRDIFYNNAARFLRLSEEEIIKHHEIVNQ
jgi:predicted TIM-barrel fold metal-dependent hydrolase